MSYENSGRSYETGGARPARPAPRSSISSRGGSSAPMGSTVAIVVTAIAVLLAFFILRKVNDSGETSTVDPGTVATSATTAVGDTTFTTIAVVPTTVGFTKIGTSIQVINCSNQEGVARNMSNALAAEGFTMVEPDTGTIDLPVTKILYNPDDPLALPVAQSVATLLANAVVESSGPVVPTLTTGTWVPGSSVIVLLGDDLAGKTLAQIAGAETTGTTAATTATTTV